MTRGRGDSADEGMVLYRPQGLCPLSCARPETAGIPGQATGLGISGIEIERDRPRERPSHH